MRSNFNVFLSISRKQINQLKRKNEDLSNSYSELQQRYEEVSVNFLFIYVITQKTKMSILKAELLLLLIVLIV